MKIVRVKGKAEEQTTAASKGHGRESTEDKERHKVFLFVSHILEWVLENLAT
jgi:hypothetical protein